MSTRQAYYEIPEAEVIVAVHPRMGYVVQVKDWDEEIIEMFQIDAGQFYNFLKGRQEQNLDESRKRQENWSVVDLMDEEDEVE